MTKMLPPRLMNQTADYMRPAFHVEVDNDVSRADIMTPAFWGHHVASLKRGALIDVVRRDYTLDMQLRVLEVGKSHAVVRELRCYEDAAAAAQLAAVKTTIEEANADRSVEDALPEEYKINVTTRGPKAGFSVLYKPTDTKIAEGIVMREDAVKQALAHARSIGLAIPAREPAPTTEPA